MIRITEKELAEALQEVYDFGYSNENANAAAAIGVAGTIIKKVRTKRRTVSPEKLRSKHTAQDWEEFLNGSPELEDEHDDTVYYVNNYHNKETR